MEAIGHAGIREHKEAHAACVADAVQLASELHRLRLMPGVVERLCGLREWVWNHVAGKDASMLRAVRRSRGG